MIRNYTEKDIDRVMEIWLSVSLKAHNFIEGSFWREQASVVREKYLPCAQILVYEKDKKIVGFIAVLEKNIVGALFVDTAYQRQGIGKTLLKAAEKKYGSLELSVYQENKNAVLFYKKQGFHIQEERECSAVPGHKEYSMTKEK